MMNDIQYMTSDLMAEELAGFNWPAPYTIEDDGMGILVSFPACRLYFSEDWEGDVHVQFLSDDTGVDLHLALGHALLVLIPEAERGDEPLAPGLIGDASIDATEQKVRNGIKDNCTLLLTHCRHILLGDFSWVERYMEMWDKMKEGEE